VRICTLIFPLRNHRRGTVYSLPAGCRSIFPFRRRFCTFRTARRSGKWPWHFHRRRGVIPALAKLASGTPYTLHKLSLSSTHGPHIRVFDTGDRLSLSNAWIRVVRMQRPGTTLGNQLQTDTLPRLKLTILTRFYVIFNL
jgi:hypothetical protein